MNYLSEIKYILDETYGRWDVTGKKRLEDKVTETVLIKMHREIDSTSICINIGFCFTAPNYALL